MLSGLKAIDITLLSHFCIYTIHSYNIYYVKRPFYFFSGYICPDIFTAATGAQAGATGAQAGATGAQAGASGAAGATAGATLWQNPCIYWLFRVLNKF